MPAQTASLAFFERWFDPIAETILSGHPEIELMRLSYGAPVADTAARIRNAHGYQMSARTELLGPWLGDEALLVQCPDLLAITSSGAGFDTIDVAACTRAGVIVCSQTGTNANAVAEHALGLMLSLAKKIAVSDKRMRSGGDLDRFRLGATDLEGKTVGIVGLGNIGRRTAALCRAFGTTIIACDPFLDAATVEDRGARKVGLPELLAEADLVSVHCPRSAETLGMFGLDQFRQMKRSAFFINTARGGIHDEDALADALRAGLIAGAGVDVFLQEPARPEHPLLGFENVVASPHIAGVTDGAMRNMAAAAAEQWVTILGGEVPPRLVNPAAWPLYSDRYRRILGRSPASLA